MKKGGIEVNLKKGEARWGEALCHFLFINFFDLI